MKMRLLLSFLLLPAVAALASEPSPEPEGAEMKVSEQATFAAGCFWGVQYEFDRIEGVTASTVGYTGGHTDNPTYEDVCSDATGHAEAVRVEFDPAVVSYGQLLDAFWQMHDPTTLNRQGPDVGSQYRSVIFYHNDQQKDEALTVKAALEKSGKFQKRVVTEIVPATEFWPAEEYHQKYFAKHGVRGCHVSR